MGEPTAVEKIKAAIWSIENQTPIEVDRLRKLLCMANGMLRARSNKATCESLILDAINRELGVDDLKLAKFKNKFENKKSPQS